MRPGMKCIRERLENVVPILLVIGDIQSKAGDERALEAYAFSIRLRLEGLCGEFLHAEEHKKRQEEISYKLFPIARQKVVRYAILDNPMFKEYQRYMQSAYYACQEGSCWFCVEIGD